MKHPISAATFVAACLTSQAALAQDDGQVARATSPIDLSASAAVGSDYVWRGLTQTGGKPAAFVSVTAAHDGFYAGAGTENVDFGGISQEYDLWGGYMFTAGDSTIDLGLSFYGYVDSPQDIDTLEAKLAVTRTRGKLTYSTAAYYTANYFGTGKGALYLEANGAWQLSDKLSGSAAAGIQNISSLDDYVTWNAGLTYQLGKRVKLDLRYHDTHGYTEDSARGAALLTYAF